MGKITLDQAKEFFNKFYNTHLRDPKITPYLETCGIGWGPDVPASLDLAIPRERAIYRFSVTLNPETPEELRQTIPDSFEGIQIVIVYRETNARLF